MQEFSYDRSAGQPGAAVTTPPNVLSPRDAFAKDRAASAESPVPEPAAVPTSAGPWSQRTATLMGVQILGAASYVPEMEITNADLQRLYGFDPAWIEQRTGILARRHAPPYQATSDLCIEAARRVIRETGVDQSQIDLVVVGTFTPDYQCPSTANLVQHALRLDAPAIDVAAACSGFVYALATASQYVATGNSKLALVIGGDCNSRIVNPRDQKIAPLFGDGAGAVLVARGGNHQGLVSYQLGSDGGGCSMLDRPSGGSRQPTTHDDLDAGLTYLQMDGRNVFKWAVRAVCESIRVTLAKANVSINDVSLFLLHQANIRIINYAIEQLGLSPDRLYNNLERYGNTSGGSIPIALSEALAAGRIRRGDLVLMCGFGAGLTWGTSLIRW